MKFDALLSFSKGYRKYELDKAMNFRSVYILYVFIKFFLVRLIF